ncbi:folate family ECF transporter S component [Christensenella sp. MSJ-20]|uniref:folate family ECF transporter S component n=1 Tax=Christensenella sp. MSJ-20 TaxID=2841518 RepID=UPI001C79615B|nr:folate family ECF transporter S component [Christensenella sp. MSJ-20]
MSQKENSPVLFQTPFSPAYWRCAAGELKNLRVLALTALFVGLRVVLAALFIPVGENLRIYFSFFINALSCYISGPILALISGFASDILGYLLFPSGAFFPGYTLSTMLGSLFFALFLYRAKLSVLRIFFCKLSINLLINVGLGSLWSAILYGKGYLFYLARSLGKNLLLLVPEVVLIVLFFRMTLPILETTGLAVKQPQGVIPLVGLGGKARVPYTKPQLGILGITALVLLASMIHLAFGWNGIPERLFIGGRYFSRFSLLLFPLLSVIFLELGITLSLFLPAKTLAKIPEKGRENAVRDLRTGLFLFCLILVALFSLMGFLRASGQAIPLHPILGAAVLGLLDALWVWRQLRRRHRG